jgi:hypothetical protein
VSKGYPADSQPAERVALMKMIIIILIVFILTANGFLPGGCRTAIRHNTQITHITQNNTTSKQNTAQKFTHTIHALHKMNNLSLEYNDHNHNYIK